MSKMASEEVCDSLCWYNQTLLRSVGYGNNAVQQSIQSYYGLTISVYRNDDASGFQDYVHVQSWKKMDCGMQNLERIQFPLKDNQTFYLRVQAENLFGDISNIKFHVWSEATSDTVARISLNIFSGTINIQYHECTGQILQEYFDSTNNRAKVSDVYINGAAPIWIDKWKLAIFISSNIQFQEDMDSFYKSEESRNCAPCLKMTSEFAATEPVQAIDIDINEIDTLDLDQCLQHMNHVNQDFDDLQAVKELFKSSQQKNRELYRQILDEDFKGRDATVRNDLIVFILQSNIQTLDDNVCFFRGSERCCSYAHFFEGQHVNQMYVCRNCWDKVC